MISVVIPAHNRGEFLARTLQSASDQEGINFEIIVVDDNSSENLCHVIDRFQCTYVRNSENRGGQYSRNKGVELARYPYIAFLDSDDIWHCKNKLRCQMEVLSNNPGVSFVYTPLRFIDENDNLIHDHQCENRIELIKKPLNSLLIKDSIGTFSCVMVRKKDFLRVGGCDETQPARQDWDLWIRLAEIGDIAKDWRTSVSYRMHPDQITSSGRKKLDGLLGILEKHKDKFDSTFRTKIAYYINLLKVSLLVGFYGDMDKSKLSTFDTFLITCFSKLAIIYKLPCIGPVFIKILKRTYLFRGFDFN